jgi:uncharacterized membrane protein
MAAFTAPKTDQLNTDSLIGGPITVTITAVRANEGSAEQPVSISYEGDGGKPYKPCKSMRRVMVHCWGADAKAYIGRSLTLYCDPNVQFGGMKVGGIRISHMTHLDEPKIMALTATKAKRANFTVQPLQVAQPIDVAGLIAQYGAVIDSVEFAIAEKARGEIWKRISAADKALLKQASDKALAAVEAAT